MRHYLVLTADPGRDTTWYLLLPLDEDVVEVGGVGVVVLHLVRGHPAMYPGIK